MIVVNKVHRYRLYPTTEQKIMFVNTFGCARFIYNRMLGDRLVHDAIGIEDISVKAIAKRERWGMIGFGKSLAVNGCNMFTNKL